MKKTKVTFTSERLRISSEILRALAHPLRLQILGCIDKFGTSRVNKIYRELEIEQSITSQHLKIMRECGVLSAERNGKSVHYSINYDVVRRASNAVNNFVGKVA